MGAKIQAFDIFQTPLSSHYPLPLIYTCRYWRGELPSRQPQRGAARPAAWNHRTAPSRPLSLRPTGSWVVAKLLRLISKSFARIFHIQRQERMLCFFTIFIPCYRPTAFKSLCARGRMCIRLFPGWKIVKQFRAKLNVAKSCTGINYCTG